jgi:hypothetical protein
MEKELNLLDIEKILYDYCDKKGFVVDFNDVVKWLGYSRKAKAKSVLLKDFKENVDFKIFGEGKNERITLTYDCFECFYMSARTKNARLFRHFHIKQLKDFKILMEQIQRGEVSITYNRRSSG